MALTRPVDFTVFTERLVREIKTSLGLIAIIDSPTVQKAPRPKLPYVSFNIRGPSFKYGFDSVKYVSEENYTVGGQRKMTISFSCYAETQEEAYGIMTTWQAALELPTVQDRFRAAGMPVWSSEPVVDLSQLLNTGWEARAQMDAYFGFASNLSVDLGRIDTVEGTGTVQAGEADKSFDFEADAS